MDTGTLKMIFTTGLKKIIENEQEDNQAKQLFQPSPSWTTTTTSVPQGSPLYVPSSLVPSVPVASMNGELEESALSTKTSVDGESKTLVTDTKEAKVEQELIFDENKNKKNAKLNMKLEQLITGKLGHKLNQWHT